MMGLRIDVIWGISEIEMIYIYIYIGRTEQGNLRHIGKPGEDLEGRHFNNYFL
jgi:hypothetical protein